MSSAEKPLMKASTKRGQWLWFVILWCAGLLITLLVAYAFRWLVGNMYAAMLAPILI
jgi:hypothetical protein